MPRTFFEFHDSKLTFWESFSKLSNLKIDFSGINSLHPPIYELSAILTNNNEIKFSSSFSPQVENNQILCASIKFQDTLHQIGLRIYIYTLYLVF